MKKLKEFYNPFFGGIAAGILVGIGGTVLLSCEIKAVGAMLFTVALLSICCLDLYLFTGKIGFAAEKFDSGLPVKLLVGLASNFIGATVTGWAVAFARPALVEKAAQSCTARLESGILRAFILGCLCGVLMYVAVKIYRQGSISGIIFCIPTFILAGFEHSIADMFYFSLAKMINLEYLGFIIAVIFGNSVGALAVAALRRFSAQPENEERKNR